MEIRLLCDHRDDLVAERTRIVNRLRWHLLELCPELEPAAGRGAWITRCAERRSPAGCNGCPPSQHGYGSRAQLATSIRAAHPRGNAHRGRAARAWSARYRPQLLAELGCGTLTAAILIGRTAGAERFQTDAQLRAPGRHRADPVSSGNATATD